MQSTEHTLHVQVLKISGHEDWLWFIMWMKSPTSCRFCASVDDSVQMGSSRFIAACTNLVGIEWKTFGICGDLMEVTVGSTTAELVVHSCRAVIWRKAPNPNHSRQAYHQTDISLYHQLGHHSLTP